MQLKHIKSLTSGSEKLDFIQAVAWSPNCQKLAVATSDRVITLYDEVGEKKDRFATKASDPAKSSTYGILSISFSPDSTKLAVAQTDGSIYIYKLGLEWGEKKTICNKFIQTSEVTCMVWPQGQMNALVFGLSDGKVRLGNLKTNKASTLFQEESPVVSICSSIDGQAIASGHLDGSICRFFFNDEISDASQGKFCQHQTTPLSLAWNENIVAIGTDGVLCSYNKNGSIEQKLESSSDSIRSDYSHLALNPTGQIMVLGGFNGVRQFTFQGKEKKISEIPVRVIDNFYAVTCVCWKNDGSRLVIGNTTGRVEIFDYSLKKTRYKGKFDFIFTSDSQVIVKRLATGSRIVLKSHLGYPIKKLDIFRDKFIVAYTTHSILVGDLSSCKLSELPWKVTGNERLYFDLENICLIFNDGELSIVEYGSNEIMGCCRTEFVNPHLISVRFNENDIQTSNTKVLAYMADEQTIQITDLVNGNTIANIAHDYKVTWLELSVFGDKILFKDTKSQLFLYNLELKKKFTLTNFCSYAQWVPMSDVVVAQNNGNLLVWYFVDSPDKVTIFPIKGDIETIERNDKQTNVIVNEGLKTITYALEESLIAFASFYEQKDYSRALALLESFPMNEQTSALWNKLGKLALDQGNIIIAERAFAALGDISTTRFLRTAFDIFALSNHSTQLNPHDVHVKTKLAILKNEFKDAEYIYLQHGMVDEAMAMYQDIHQWEKSIRVAEIKGHSELNALKKGYETWLLQTGQNDVAGGIKEIEGRYNDAIHIYLNGGFPGKAANVIISHHMESDKQLTERVTESLIQHSLYEKAGQLYELIGNFSEALDAFGEAKAFASAIRVCRSYFPQRTVEFEKKWADYLFIHGKMEPAVNHYLEAGDYVKAIQSAISGNLYSRAVSIIESIPKSEVVWGFYQKIADYYKQQNDFDLAEKYYLEAGLAREAIEMHLNAKNWSQAYALAKDCWNDEEIQSVFYQMAIEYEEKNEINDTEALYCAMGEPDQAITMYKELERYNDMIRLVKIYHPEALEQTYAYIAKIYEKEGSWSSAEQYYLSAKDIKSVINMYCMNDMFESAFKFAKTHGSAELPAQVAYVWAKSLGGESGFKVLNKIGLLDQVIPIALDRTAFDFVMSLIPYLKSSWYEQIHHKHGLFLEDEGKFEEAEKAFLKAKKPKEAILMHVHNENWDAALAVAERHSPEALVDIIFSQATVAFQRKDYSKMESLVLRTTKPELGIKFYKDAGMWKEALEFARRHLPQQVNEIQSLVQSMNTVNGSVNMTNVSEAYQYARQLEMNRKYEEAIQIYLKLAEASKPQLSIQGWLRAVEIAGKYTDATKARQVALQVVTKLQNISKFDLSGDLYAGLGMQKESIEMYVKGQTWEKAKKAAEQFLPSMKSFVENAYVTFMKTNHHSDPSALLQVDKRAGLDALAKKGQWDKCLEVASQESSEMLAIYLNQLALKASSVENWKRFADFVLQYNIPSDNSLGSAYYQFGVSSLSSQDELLYKNSSKILKSLTSQSSFSALIPLATALHFLAFRSTLKSNKDMSMIVSQLSMAMMRYTNIYPLDLALYESGKFLKVAGSDSLAFIYWNILLDVYDAIEDQDTSLLDEALLKKLGAPDDKKMPIQLMPEKTREEVRNWVLQTAIEKKINKELSYRQCGQCKSQVFSAGLECQSCGLLSDESIVTGLPVDKPSSCFKCKKTANQDEWKLIISTFKACPWCEQSQN